MKWSTLVLLLAFALALTDAKIIDVAENCPVSTNDCYQHIVEAIDRATGSDLIHLQPGTYSLNVTRTYLHKTLNIFGLGHPHDVILTCPTVVDGDGDGDAHELRATGEALQHSRRVQERGDGSILDGMAFNFEEGTLNLGNVTISGCSVGIGLFGGSAHLNNVLFENDGMGLLAVSANVVADGELSFLDCLSVDVQLYSTNMELRGSVYHRGEGNPWLVNSGALYVAGSIVVEGIQRYVDDDDASYFESGTYVIVEGDFNVTASNGDCVQVYDSALYVGGNVNLYGCAYEGVGAYDGGFVEILGDVYAEEVVYDAGLSVGVGSRIMVYGNVEMDKIQVGLYIEEGGMLHIMGNTSITFFHDNAVELNNGGYLIFEGPVYLGDSRASNSAIYCRDGGSVWAKNDFTIANVDNNPGGGGKRGEDNGDAGGLDFSDGCVGEFDGRLTFRRVYNFQYSGAGVYLEESFLITYGVVTFDDIRGQDAPAVYIDGGSWLSVDAVYITNCHTEDTAITMIVYGVWKAMGAVTYENNMGPANVNSWNFCLYATNGVGAFTAPVTMINNKIGAIVADEDAVLTFSDVVTIANSRTVYQNDGLIASYESTILAESDFLLYNNTNEFLPGYPTISLWSGSLVEVYGALVIDGSRVEGEDGSAMVIDDDSAVHTYGPVTISRCSGSLAAVKIQRGSWLNHGFAPVFSENDNTPDANVFCRLGQFSYNFETCDELSDNGFNCTRNCTSYAPLGKLALSSSATSLIAGGSVTFTVTLESALEVDLSVPFYFQLDQDAWEYVTASMDFDSYFVILAGETSASLELTVADPTVEEDITYTGVFYAYGATPHGYTLFSDQTSLAAVDIAFFAPTTTTAVPDSASTLTSFVHLFV